MSYYECLRACLSRSLIQGVRPLFDLSTVPVVTNLVATINVMSIHTYGVMMFFCIGLKHND
ncbi:hypothetical protein K08M3_06010 [Vibrio alginolyticus]|uniref:Uncharacterized protein n=1 Tax=Vibrio alginolyticus TaxID=663 RepID=A0A1W6U388_VIBAL|nr:MULTISPECIES: hypothetical protein [Vibrio harveyi group]ARO97589.1 hypothetical protein K01M1_06000 [Vibrio alginolyticus]ARP02317.1 hypothetical protein K04M1_06340 [Vibrio alginolyticus]ARP07350.1 hypothetical protein K04M3_06010 [Vibrio alginolyticus]ARP12436.1 hypothetical protein K04M5_06010 [Vibrio alginolyticus]ARP17497.1 hypothetical protein K05K4_06260 [Vibrio alginolyticus]